MTPGPNAQAVGPDLDGFAMRADLSPGVASAIVFDELEAAGTRWCLLRGEPTSDRGDLDLLVHPADAERAWEAMASSGFARLRDRSGLPGRSWAAGPLAGGVWQRIDCRMHLEFGDRCRLDRDALLAGTAVADGVRRPSRDDEFWTLLFHGVLDAAACGTDHRSRLAELATDATTGAAVLRSTDPPFLPAAVERILAAARSGEWEAVGALLERLAGRRERRRRIVARASRRTKRLIGLVRRADPGGYSVAVLGPDGVGKTTICEGVARAYVRPVVQVSVGRKLSRHRVWGRVPPPVRRAARFAAFVETCARAWVAQRRGRVVLWDRHPDDPAVGEARVRSRRWARGLAPDPDLVVVLDAPPAVIRARKAERDEDELVSLRRAYRALAEAAPRAEVVDAAADATTVRNAVLAALWRHDPARIDEAGDRTSGGGPRPGGAT